jgi:NAD(P)-dependent dehydrogenase (short-subunit alcohol dehydrogenase family)
VSCSAADIPGLHGRVAVVTGANGGLGLEPARQLAVRGAHVVMAVRDQQKVAAAVEAIRSSAGPGFAGVPCRCRADHSCA